MIDWGGGWFGSSWRLSWGLRRAATDERLFPTLGRFEKAKREGWLGRAGVSVVWGSDECVVAPGDEAGFVETV